MERKKISDSFSVSSQLSLEDIASLKAQGIKTIINHLYGIAQILLTVVSSSQISKVGSDACIVGWVVILIETYVFNSECKVFIHRDLASNSFR